MFGSFRGIKNLTFLDFDFGHDSVFPGKSEKFVA